MSKDLTSLKEQAARAMLRGDWNAALAQLQQARELAPRDTHVALKIGDMYQRLGKRGEAIVAYKQAASLFAAAGFLVKAISVAKLILSLDPSDRQMQATLAELYSAQRAERGLPEEAEASVAGTSVPEAPAKEARPTPSKLPPGAPSAPPSEAPPAAPSTPPADDSLLPDIDLARIDPDQLPRTPLLSDLSREELEAVIDQMVVTFAASGTVVCREGEPAESMYVIVHGLVRVSSRDPSGNPLWLTNLHEGDFFGEFGLLSDGQRHADVVAAEDTELLQIGRAQLESLVAQHPRIEAVLLAFYKERVVDTLLAKAPLTRSLTPEQRRGLIERAGLEIHADGSMIIQEGDEGLHLFVIKSGQVEVSTGLGERRIDLAVLQTGDIFGEISLLTGTPATANVVARGRVELLKFSRREVVELAQRHPQLAHLLAETKEHRVHETVQRIQIEGFV